MRSNLMLVVLIGIGVATASTTYAQSTVRGTTPSRPNKIAVMPPPPPPRPDTFMTRPQPPRPLGLLLPAIQAAPSGHDIPTPPPPPPSNDDCMSCD